MDPVEIFAGRSNDFFEQINACPTDINVHIETANKYIDDIQAVMRVLPLVEEDTYNTLQLFYRCVHDELKILLKKK